MEKDTKKEIITINPEKLNIDTEELDEAISDAISNITGFCHKGFTYEIKATAILDISE